MGWAQPRCRDLPQVEDRLDCYHEQSQRSLRWVMICLILYIITAIVQVTLLLIKLRGYGA
jgi:hypothetical protein